MKTLSCDLCDHEVSAETFEEWMNALKPHYMECHREVVENQAGTKEEMMLAMKKWMEDNQNEMD